MSDVTWAWARVPGGPTEGSRAARRGVELSAAGPSARGLVLAPRAPLAGVALALRLVLALGRAVLVLGGLALALGCLLLGGLPRRRAGGRVRGRRGGRRGSGRGRGRRSGRRRRSARRRRPGRRVSGRGRVSG